MERRDRGSVDERAPKRLAPPASNTTAHPAKFPAAIAAADINTSPVLPNHLADLFEREETFDVLPNDLQTVQQFMAANCRA